MMPFGAPPAFFPPRGVWAPAPPPTFWHPAEHHGPGRPHRQHPPRRAPLRGASRRAVLNVVFLTLKQYAADERDVRWSMHGMALRRNERMLARAWRAWAAAVAASRVRQATAWHLWSVTCLKRTVAAWAAVAVQGRRLRQAARAVQQRRLLHGLRRWRCAAGRHREEAHLATAATRLRRRTLARRVWRAWVILTRHNVAVVLLQHCARDVALRSCVQQWQCTVQARRRHAQRRAVVEFVHRQRRRRAHAVLFHWRTVVHAAAKTRYKREALGARVWFRTVRTPFAAWRQFVAAARHRRLLAVALYFRRLGGRVLRSWAAACVSARRAHSLDTIHSKRRLLHIMYAFKAFAAAAKRRRAAAAVARRHCVLRRTRLMRKVVRSWRTAVLIRARQRRGVRRLTVRQQQALLRRCWTGLHAMQHVARMQRYQAHRHFVVVSCRRVLRAWAKVPRVRREASALRAKTQSTRARRVALRAFQQWRASAAARRRFRRGFRRLVSRHHAALLHRTWRVLATSRGAAVAHRAAVLQAATDRRHSRMKHAAFTRWRQAWALRQACRRVCRRLAGTIRRRWLRRAWRQLQGAASAAWTAMRTDAHTQRFAAHTRVLQEQLRMAKLEIQQHTARATAADGLLESKNVQLAHCMARVREWEARIEMLPLLARRKAGQPGVPPTTVPVPVRRRRKGKRASSAGPAPVAAGAARGSGKAAGSAFTRAAAGASCCGRRSCAAAWTSPSVSSLSLSSVSSTVSATTTKVVQATASSSSCTGARSGAMARSRSRSVSRLQVVASSRSASTGGASS